VLGRRGIGGPGKIMMRGHEKEIGGRLLGKSGLYVLNMTALQKEKAKKKGRRLQGIGKGKK